MTQEDKDLLLKDLCARLPHGVKVNITSKESKNRIINLTVDNISYVTNGWWSECKPYLFPLSSMTEEQWNNAPRVNLTEFTFESFKCGCFTLASYTCDNDLHYLVEFVNWLIENRFDIYGLIPKGLAKDATGKNIY